MGDKLPPHQYALLVALASNPADTSIESISRAAELDQALISAAAVELANADFLSIEEQAYTELQLGELGTAIARGEAELPERLLARAVRARGCTASIKELHADEHLQKTAIHPGKLAKRLAQLGWASFEGGTLTLAGEAATAEPSASDTEIAISAVHVSGGTLEVTADTDTRVRAGTESVRGRKELVTARSRSRRFLKLTPAGEQLAARIGTGEIAVLQEVNELTPKMLSEGSWREVDFRPYDVTLAAECVTPGKEHPLARIVEQTRLAFLELGFSEANCLLAESAFWVFDALFQPQDHPAREMQDTFYCETPASFTLPDAASVQRVKRTHEDGWETGSRGWRYSWSPERAAQVVLRTHMTASSIEAIARDPNPPQKIFSIGRVFRRETVDFKHLPEFMQVDGIIIDEHASFSSLLGTLAKFYERMGILEVAFKPDFFPYTEPSVGAQIRWGGQWFEMGGAGVFRPEVTLPFGCKVPVLAWGLGLERLAMAYYGVEYIRDLYRSDLDWLRSVPLEA